MTPPDSGDGAVPVPQTSSSEAEQRDAQSIEAPAAPESVEVTPLPSDDEETDEMVEHLQDLILEAYSSMQSDGEYIFLPEEVAEKLHRVADEMLLQEKQDSGEEMKEEEKIDAPSAGQDSGSGDAAAKNVEMKEPQDVPVDRPEPEQEQGNQEQEHEEEKQENAETGEKARQQKVQALQAEAAELREEKQKQRMPRVRSSENLFSELAPVPEIDEESSGTPSPSPPLSRSQSGASTPQLRPRTPAQSRHGHFPPPPIISLSSTPSSIAASPDKSGWSPASRTPDRSGGAKHVAKTPTYEMRKKAAQKLKEDRKKRQLHIRESAHKQREDLKRQLDRAHQKEMEEKRERVRRIREERLQRRTGKTAPKSK